MVSAKPSVAPPEPVTSQEAAAAEAVGQATSAAAVRMPRFGVALMDNEREINSGWACASDGQPYYFTNIAQLSNDTIWVASMEWSAYQAKGRHMHNLRRVDYLRTPIQRIAADMGLRIDGHHGRFAAQALAQVVQRCVSACATLYGWRDPASELREDVLYEDLRRSITQPPKSKPHVLPVLSAAFQGSSSPSWPHLFEDASLSVTLRFNRLRYAQQLLSVMVPDEGWSVQLNEREIRPETVLDPQRPSLVEATVEMGRTDPEVATLCAFGSYAGRRGSLRRWISQPELAWLVKHARVQIQTAIVCRTGRSLPVGAKLPPALVEDPLNALSISAGLVAECHLFALASETYNRTLRNKQVSGWAVWLRAHDRASCFGLALAALRKGFLPLSYGNGAVTLRLRKQQLPHLLEFAAEHDMAYPSLHPYFVEHGLAHAGQEIPPCPID